MRHFKVFKLGTWEIHELEDNIDEQLYLPIDAIEISIEEASTLSTQPPSEEYKTAIAEAAAALGGRNNAIYPTKDVKEVIGAICVHSALLEVTLRTIIWHVAGVKSDVGMALTGGKLSINELISMLSSLLEKLYPELHQNIKPLIQRIEELNKLRGKYVHGVWSPDKDGRLSVSKSFLARDDKRAKMESVDINQLHNVAEGYLDVMGGLNKTILFPLLYPLK